MLPMIAVRKQTGILLADDATTLAPATNANKIALIGAAFSLNENLVLSSLTLLTGGGLTAITGTVGAQAVAIDPVTGDQIITLLPGTGTWRWVSSGGAGYPKTVYGYALVDNGIANLLAAQTLATPIVLTADGQQVDLDPITMRFVLQPIS